MKKIGNIALTIASLVSVMSIASCKKATTYTLSEIADLDVSKISYIRTCDTMSPSTLLNVPKAVDKYLDCEYIESDFDYRKIEDAMCFKSDGNGYGYLIMAYVPTSGGSNSTYAGKPFYVDKKDNYMYYSGLEGTYRTKNTMSPLFMEMISKPINEYEKHTTATVSVDYGEYQKGKVTYLYDNSLIPDKIKNAYKGPIVAGDVIHLSYIGEIAKKGKYPSKIKEDGFDILNLGISHGQVVRYSVIESRSGGKTLYPLDDKALNNKLTDNCINEDGTFISYEKLELDTVVYSIEYEGDAIAFYTYNPLRTSSSN